MRKLLAALAVALLAAGCAVSSDGGAPLPALGHRVANALVEVKPENRDVRICLIAAGGIEVLTDLAQRGADVRLAIGNLMLLQNAVDGARDTDTLWGETDNADVTLLFARVLKDTVKSRFLEIIAGGPTISNLLGVVRRATVLTVKGRAVLLDINAMLKGVDDGTLDKARAWRACENRIVANRRVLEILTGGAPTR